MRHILLLLLGLLLPLSAQAGVYRCKDANGQMVISDKPCPGAVDEQRRYQVGKPSAPEEEGEGEADDADLIDEVARRRDFYIKQGYPKDIAAQKAMMELSPPAGQIPASQQPQEPRSKSGRDNMRDYLDMRERDKAEQQQAQDDWRQRSDEYDRDREKQQRQEAVDKRRSDCEERRRIETLRNGYSSRRCD